MTAMRLFRLIWQAIRSANWPRLGAAISINLATYSLGTVAVVVSFILGWLVYGWLSGWGAIYGFKDIPTGEWEPLRLDQTLVLSRDEKTGRGLTIFAQDVPIVFVNIKRTDSGIRVEWEYAYSLWEEIIRREGISSIRDGTSIISSSNSIVPLYVVKNVTIEVPSGTLSPLLQQMISYGIQRAKLEIEPNQISALVSSIRERLLHEEGFLTAYKRVTDSAFWVGEIQFLTLVSFIFFILLKLIGLFTYRLSQLCAFVLEVMPYLGFYGTLLGMGYALQILGFADISDSVRKAISLGPIGSQMGLAIETTKFALVFYLAGGLLGQLLDIVSEKLREETGAEPEPSSSA
jgi:hypothetical protein